jgi:1,4-alpha-glucan branching enzyme
MDKKFYKETSLKKQSSQKKDETVKKEGIPKRYIKTRQSCKVTFNLPKAAIKDGKKVSLVGDFNKWNPEITPLKQLKNGSFSTTIELLSGRTYRFKYLIDHFRWENDWHADTYLPNPYGGEDSAVIV